jgi:hypothetical protein
MRRYAWLSPFGTTNALRFQSNAITTKGCWLPLNRGAIPRYLHDDAKETHTYDMISTQRTLNMTTFTFQKSRFRISHLLPMLVLGWTSACGTDSDFQRFYEESQTSPEKITNASSTVPTNLRAAYVALIQREAPASYAAELNGDAAKMVNEAQQFVSTIDPRRVTITPNDAAWYLSMRTAGVGCIDSMTATADASPTVSANRVELNRGDVDEWYLNGPLGVEQGFVLRKAPDCQGLKRIAMAIEGGLTARLEDPDGDGRGDAVRFVDATGVRAAYSDLVVTDATGKTLPSWLSVDAGEVSIAVNDEAAVYPLVVDPLLWLEQAKLTAIDGAAGDRFGYSVAISGDTAIVGANEHDIAPNNNRGAVYVFNRNGGTWTFQQKLVASDGLGGDNLGAAVAIDGDTAILGAIADDIGANVNQGSAYVFTRNGACGPNSKNYWRVTEEMVICSVGRSRSKGIRRSLER